MTDMDAQVYRATRKGLEDAYRAFTIREKAAHDPIAFLYRYKDPQDREVAAFVAAALAYGHVKIIRRSVQTVLDVIPSPAGDLEASSPARLRAALRGFRHRFAGESHIVALLTGLREARRRHGSLRACFLAGLSQGDATVLPAIEGFVDELNRGARGRCGHLLPQPRRGSVCKRLHLFLRWMVRHDAVDPGGWEDAGAHRLIVPMDTHMTRLCARLGLLRHKHLSLRAALAVTEAFRAFAPDDPVRYDFALTRIGMRGDGELAQFFTRIAPRE